MPDTFYRSIDDTNVIKVSEGYNEFDAEQIEKNKKN